MLITSISVRADMHEMWSDLLEKHVVESADGHSTAVDYTGMQTDRVLLNQYLHKLSLVTKVEYANWNKDKQLAFLINAYNAFTVSLILTKYPQIQSIKDLGSWFSSPWKKAFIPLLGKTTSLDDIEHGLIRDKRVFNEPRIHFAVNCASVGCPALRTEAYTAPKLNSQLEQQTQRFLSDKSRNYAVDNTLYLSPIFKWYREDFPVDFFADYAASLNLTQKQITRLRSEELKIRYVDYDWSLNRAP
jgi:hypothetical protein